MIKVIGFDADDTLWDYEYIYHEAKPKIAQILGQGYDFDQLFSQLDQAEVSNISFYGYGVKSFALSMLESVAMFSEKPIESTKLLALIGLIKEMLNANFEINPYAHETLRILSSRFKLILITKGEAYEQERKIERSGLIDYFTSVEVVSHKTEDTYRAVISRQGIAPQNFLMVGNSLKSDVLPVVRIGGMAVHIPHEVAWFHEEVPDKDKILIDYDQLEHLGQLPEFVLQLTSSH